MHLPKSRRELPTIIKEIVCVAINRRDTAAQIQDGATIAISGATAAAWWKLTIFWPPLKRFCKPDNARS